MSLWFPSHDSSCFSKLLKPFCQAVGKLDVCVQALFSQSADGCSMACVRPEVIRLLARFDGSGFDPMVMPCCLFRYGQPCHRSTSDGAKCLPDGCGAPGNPDTGPGHGVDDRRLQVSVRHL